MKRETAMMWTNPSLFSQPKVEGSEGEGIFLCQNLCQNTVIEGANNTDKDESDENNLKL